jgi:hypothetical protein
MGEFLESAFPSLPHTEFAKPDVPLKTLYVISHGFYEFNEVDG